MLDCQDVSWMSHWAIYLLREKKKKKKHLCIERPTNSNSGAAAMVCRLLGWRSTIVVVGGEVRRRWLGCVVYLCGRVCLGLIVWASPLYSWLLGGLSCVLSDLTVGLVPCMWALGLLGVWACPTLVFSLVGNLLI